MRALSTIAFAASAVLAGATAASAADLYAPPPPPMSSPIYAPASAYNWTGFYLGASGGWGTGNADSSNTPFDGSVSGWFAGGQLGYNYQFSNNVVVGIEGDANWSGLKGTINSGFPQITQSIDWFGTVRGRVGYAFDNVLPYVTGGVAFGSGTRTSSIGNASERLNLTGYTLGAGVEVGVAPNWTVKGEYQYINFGAVTYNNITADPNVKLDAHTFKVGANYKF